MSFCRRTSVLVLSLLAAIAAGSAGRLSAHQATPAGDRTAPLAVDFIAVHADGSPVADLETPDVEVRLNGRVRKILSVHRVAATAAAPAKTATTIQLPPPYATNEAVAVGREFVLLVDEQSFTAGHEQLLRNAVEGLLARLAPADRAMVVALPYGGVKAPFTLDQARIRQATAGIVAQGTRTESGSDMAVRTRTFLESLDGFLQTQAGRRTPLTVVLFTAGLAAPRRDAPRTMPPGVGELVVQHFKRITVTAGAARANFYVITPADIATSAAGWSENIAGANYLGSDNPLEGIEHLAGATGGTRLPLDATGTGSLVRVANETSAYYVAELEAERNEVFGRSRPLSVRVARSGVTVRARPEITFTDPTRRARASRIQDLLVSGDTVTDVSLRAAGFTVREAEGRLRVGVVVEPTDPGASLASVGALLVEANGRIAARWIGRDAAQRPLLGALAAPPGTYRLRVAAIDSAGRSGVVEEIVEARLASVGPLSLGSLMLGVSRNAGVVPQLEFGAEPSAIASFDIYGGAAGMGLAATLDVARDIEGPALVALPLTLTRADEGRVVATSTVPIGALPPGDYVVRGVIRLDSGANARVVRTLRKAAR
jgi:VWFA-related protein